ncbi:MAG: hypothetical protein GPI90_23970 [Microcystis aeruginosa K13-05]|uniref:hypothetical protein n=1 Tax=unclassified Microcystis TaxID=2643300 RepID=UPI0022CA5543|nr:MULTISPECIES: hypothetical protein [unclassified Microcystis]MCZ8365557.1 hypothetical protein [Microcystis sp. LE19-251.1A]MDJ0671424.1 hypothetical protein [Microcystis sp. M53598_WE2]NCR82784.1 hypothetical protein [Microcystis aeruginosa K13-10]NCR87471.1 hypothetical protein [Microcystis aeruginosa K13-05]MCZ8023908.1 hypothetical protein [Microcystis sp. LE19-10.1B]
MATSKLVKPHTPHPTPHTLPPPKNFLPQTLFIHRSRQLCYCIESITFSNKRRSHGC